MKAGGTGFQRKVFIKKIFFIETAAANAAEAYDMVYKPIDSGTQFLQVYVIRSERT